MLVFFNLIPCFLLLFYHTKWFQKLLGCFPCVNWLPLHAFMDIFQGCYQNGTNGTRDYRYFAGFYLMFRVLSLFPIEYSMISAMQHILLPLLFSYAFALLRPYRKYIYNICDTLFFFLYAFCGAILNLKYVNKHSIIIVYICSLFCFIYLLSYIVIRIWKTIVPDCYVMCQRKTLRCAKNLAPRCCFP